VVEHTAIPYQASSSTKMMICGAGSSRCPLRQRQRSPCHRRRQSWPRLQTSRGRQMLHMWSLPLASDAAASPEAVAKQLVAPTRTSSRHPPVLRRARPHLSLVDSHQQTVVINRFMAIPKV